MYHCLVCVLYFFFFSSRRRHTRCLSDWSSDVCSSDLRMSRNSWAKLIHTHCRPSSLNAVLSQSGPASLACLRRSEEHTSELQSLRHLVCRLLLEKKNRGRAPDTCWRSRAAPPSQSRAP